MKRLHLVVCLLRDELCDRNFIGNRLGEEDAMLIPELFYETNECASEGAKGGGRRTLLLQVTPVNLLTMLLLLQAYLACAKE